MTTENDDEETQGDLPDETGGSPTTAVMAAAFRAQVTPKLYRMANRYARRRALVIRDAGRVFDRFYTRAVVADVLGEIWSGAIPWDPSETTLLDRVCESVGTRMRRDATRARTYPQVPIEGTATEDRFDVSVEAQVTEAHASSGDLSPMMLRAAATAVGRELEKIATDNPAARLMARAWGDGHIKRAEVLSHTGISDVQWGAARRTLLSLAESLPRELSEVVTDLLRRAS